MTNRNGNYNWNNTPWNPTTNWSNWTNNTNNNPFTAFNVAPFTSNPLTSTLTTLVNTTPNTPSVNAYENTDTYVFELAAPGYTKESFDVSYSYNPNMLYNTLTIKGNSENERNNNYSYREFNYSSFTREFNLPNNVDLDETRAKYENGILTVLVPKTTTNNTNYRSVKIS